ncbi:MAG: DUF1772 domain-containing protein [Acidobacteriota bacterium]
MTFPVVLGLATLLSALVAGLVFTFACIVMPGIGTLNDREFLQAFAAIDRVIQNNQPAFLVVWIGSVVALVAAAGVGLGQLAGIDRSLLLAAVVLYLGGVQAPTIGINIPLNNQLQTLALETMDASSLARARDAFEARWTRWNTFRTVLAITTTCLLLVVVLRL